MNLHGNGLSHREADIFILVLDGQLRAFPQQIGGGFLLHIDFQDLAPEGQREAQPLYGLRQFGIEGQDPAKFPHAPESIDQDHPTGPHGGNVAAISDIAFHISEIHEHGVMGIGKGFIQMTNLRGQDTLNAHGERGITCSQGVVVIKVPLFLFLGKLLPQQKQGQHYIRLFDHLTAVDFQRMKVEQQGILITRRIYKVPDLLIQEVITQCRK